MSSPLFTGVFSLNPSSDCCWRMNILLLKSSNLISFLDLVFICRRYTRDTVRVYVNIHRGIII